MILHLVDRATWDAVRHGATYSPPSLAREGFVHCTGDLDTMLRVANDFYRDAPGEHVVLELDETAVTAEVRWEAPAHPDGRPAEAGEPRFPHVYGPLVLAAVRALRPLERSADGTFTGYAGRDPVS
jgi:uncharacterized protein